MQAAAQASAPARRYSVTPLRDAQGNISPHFLSRELHLDQETWREAMNDPVFAQIIAREEDAERIAHASLDQLARLAPNERVRTMYLAWMRFIDETLDPWTTGGAIHFRPHWARVLMIALVLGDAAGLPENDLKALAMAAVFHDSRRKNPYLDTGHGMRASEYYKATAGLVDGNAEETETASAVRSFIILPRATFDPRSFLIVRWHDRDDADGFAAFERAADLLEQTPADAQADVALLYRLFKDADGLDRVRLGSGQLDKRFLRTQGAIDAVPFAHELLEASLSLSG